VSELIISVMLIALGFGWTLGLESQEPLSGQLGKLLAGLHSPGKLLRSALTPSTLLLGTIAAAQLGLLAMGRRYEEDFNKFHDFEHAPGLALLGIRLALCALFGWALRRSLRVERQKDVREFFGALAFFGSIWFAGLPILVLSALVLPPYRRHQVVAGGSVLVQVRPARRPTRPPPAATSYPSIAPLTLPHILPDPSIAPLALPFLRPPVGCHARAPLSAVPRGLAVLQDVELAIRRLWRQRWRRRLLDGKRDETAWAWSQDRRRLMKTFRPRRACKTQ